MKINKISEQIGLGELVGFSIKFMFKVYQVTNHQSKDWWLCLAC